MRRLNILFIYPVPRQTKKIYTGFHQGIGLISAVLKQDGHSIHLLIIDQYNPDQLVTALNNYTPDVILATITTNQLYLARQILETCYAHTPVPILVGGPHPTALPYDCLSINGVHAVCVGYGEAACRAYIRALSADQDPSGIPGIIRKEDTRQSFIEPGKAIPISELPFPDRGIFPFQELINSNADLIGAEFMTSRGCPYQCHYCVNNTLAQLYPRNISLSLRQPAQVIEEIQTTQRAYHGIRLIGFHDDTFMTGNDDWLYQLLAQYKHTVGLPFWCNSRPEALTDARLKALKKAGCARVHIGLETGNQQLRQTILGRDISNDVIIDAFRRAHIYGIKTLSFNILGLPDETESTILETIALNQACKPDWMLYSLFYPYPGTHLWHHCVTHNLITCFPGPDYPDSYYSGIPVIRYEHLSVEKLVWVFNHFVGLVRKSIPFNPLQQ